MTMPFARVFKLSGRSLLLAAVCLAVASPTAFAQPSATPDTKATGSAAHTFDVATIKPIAPDGRPTHGWVGLRNRPDSVEAAYITLPELLCYAYGYMDVRFDGQVTGLPDWALTQKYDIEGKIGAADLPTFQKLSSDEQWQWREAMLQSLLAERFSLTLHRGNKQIPIYELVVAKGGIKMKDSATDPAPPQLGKGDDGKPLSTLRWLEKTTIMQAYSMKSLAGILSMPAAFVGRPVVDKTGLTGTYNFTLDWSVYSAHAAANPSPADDATSIFSALGQLGLQLHPATGPIDTIVIDHVEHPTAD
jgi:uncharacterized protein (TIGR03435 family)